MWLAWSASCLPDEQLIVVTAHDVTDYKSANELNIDLVGQTQLLHLIDKSMLVMDSLEEIAGLVVDALTAMLDCKQVVVLLDDTKSKTAHILAESNVPYDQVGQVFSYDPTADHEQRLAMGEIVTCEDMRTLETLSPIQHYMYEHGVRSFVCIPLIVEDKILGVTLLGRSQIGEMDWHHEKTATDTITQFGVAIYQFQLKAKLAEEGETLRTLIDHIPDYIFVKDREGRFRISNFAHAAAVNLEPDDLIGKTAEELFASDLAPQFHEDDMAVMASGEPLINEERLTSGIDGELIHVLTTKVPLIGETGEITGLVGVSRNITMRKYAEASRAEAAQLRVQLQKEKELSDLKTHFILTVSHEFRTPLTIIQTSSQLLERHYERLDQAKREKLLGRILDQTRQMTRMIDDTLLAGQSQISQIPFNPAAVRVVSLSRSIFEQMQTVDQLRHQMHFNNRIAEDTELMLDAGLYREF
ncbi:MAG: PAS domain-containing protein [Aggregatilineales bacterium]